MLCANVPDKFIYTDLRFVPTYVNIAGVLLPSPGPLVDVLANVQCLLLNFAPEIHIFIFI